MTLAPVKIEIFRGDDESLDFTVEDADGAVVNVTGWTFDFKVYDVHGAEVLSKSSADGITITDGASGEVSVSLSAANTVIFAPSPARYRYRFRRTDSGFTTTCAYGRLTALEP